MSAEVFNNAIELECPKEDLRKYIGPGYRSFSYMTDFEKNGKIILFGYDTVGNPQTFIFPWRSYVKYVVKYKTDEQDVYDRYLATKWFKNAKERDNYVAAMNGATVVECMKPEQEAAHYLFDVEALDPNFNKQPLRIHYLDIETEISDVFVKPNEATNRINMITLYDSKTEKFYTWSLQDAKVEFHDFEEKVEWHSIQKTFDKVKGDADVHFETTSHEKIDVEKFDVQKAVAEKQVILKVTHNPIADMPKEKFWFKSFNNDEYIMMENFLEWYEDNWADVIYGWNVRGYDMPYIVRRIERLFGNPDGSTSPFSKKQAARLSPIGRYFVKDVNHENSRADVGAEIEVTIKGTFIADGLVLYRDKFKVKHPDGGFGLSNIGEVEELGRKIEYDGSLKDLYMKDFQKFYEYNVRDVDLCKRIDDKCKMISLARTLTSFGLSDYNKIYGSIAYLIGSVQMFAKTQMKGRILPTYLPEKKKMNGFEGAFVFPTIQAIYRGGIGVIDFASLYPSCIRALNASPETYVGKVLVYYKDPLGQPIEWKKKIMKGKTLVRIETYPCNHESEPPFDIFNDEIAKAENIDHIALLLPNGQIRAATVDGIRKLIEEKCIWTTNNTLFLKHSVKQGVISKWCEVFYGLRKKNKKIMMGAFHKLHDKNLNLTPDEIEQLKLTEQTYDILQMGLKICINSIYGIMGTSTSPIGNEHIAQTITRLGRFCNTSAAKFVCAEFKKRYNLEKGYMIHLLDEDDDGYADEKLTECATLGGDTDSLSGDALVRIRTRNRMQ